MKNKYQIALEEIWKMFNCVFNVKDMDKAIKFIDCKNTLQELIDNYSKIEKALDNSCRLAIQNNSDSYIMINRGTPEEYNLPLTFDDTFNIKILKEYLLDDREIFHTPNYKFRQQETLEESEKK